MLLSSRLRKHITVVTEEEDEIDPLDAFMLGNNATGAAQQQQADVKPDPDSKAAAGPPSRPPLAGGPAVNGKVKRAPVRRGKRSMYDTSSSSEEEEEEEQSDEEDDEVCITCATMSFFSFNCQVCYLPGTPETWQSNSMSCWHQSLVSQA